MLAAAVDEAHQVGATVTGHLCSVTFDEASALGIDNVEHGLTVASGLVEAGFTPLEAISLATSTGAKFHCDRDGINDMTLPQVA